jgi:hypothetical protein
MWSLSTRVTTEASIIISTIVICIMIFSLYVTIRYRSPEQYKNTRLNVFFSTLASVAIIFVGINIVITSLSFEYNQRFARISKTKEAVDKLWLYPNQLLSSSTHIRSEFYASFFMNNPELYDLVLLSNKKSPLTQDAIAEEQFIVTVMLQAWEDCLHIRKYDDTPLEFWLRAYLSWAQNPYFKSYYNFLKFEYQINTNELASLLFEYAEQIPVPTIDTNIYAQTVKKMMRDRRFIALMKKLTF